MDYFMHKLNITLNDLLRDGSLKDRLVNTFDGNLMRIEESKIPLVIHERFTHLKDSVIDSSEEVTKEALDKAFSSLSTNKLESISYKILSLYKDFCKLYYQNRV